MQLPEKNAWQKKHDLNVILRCLHGFWVRRDFAKYSVSHCCEKNTRCHTCHTPIHSHHQSLITTSEGPLHRRLDGTTSFAATGEEPDLALGGESESGGIRGVVRGAVAPYASRGGGWWRDMARGQSTGEEERAGGEVAPEPLRCTRRPHEEKRPRGVNWRCR